MFEEPDGSVSKAVLIVDDDPLIAVMMSQAFADEGYEPLVANNADKALEVLEVAAQKIRLIITDIMMPGSMDGLGLGYVVAERFAHIPVITMTGYRTEGRGDAVGLTMHKPFAVEHLMRVARRIIENGRFWRQMMKKPRP